MLNATVPDMARIHHLLVTIAFVRNSSGGSFFFFPIVADKIIIEYVLGRDMN